MSQDELVLRHAVDDMCRDEAGSPRSCATLAAHSLADLVRKALLGKDVSSVSFLRCLRELLRVVPLQRQFYAVANRVYPSFGNPTPPPRHAGAVLLSPMHTSGVSSDARICVIQTLIDALWGVLVNDRATGSGAEADEVDDAACIRASLSDALKNIQVRVDTAVLLIDGKAAVADDEGDTAGGGASCTTSETLSTVRPSGGVLQKCKASYENSDVAAAWEIVETRHERDPLSLAGELLKR